jgi:phosphate acetyltransferase
VGTSPWQTFRQKASKSPCKIVLADGEDPRVLQAAANAVQSRVAIPVLVGKSAVIRERWSTFARSAPPEILDIERCGDAQREAYASTLRGISKFKSLTAEEAAQKLSDPLVLGCLALRRGEVDGFIGGATRTTSDTLRAVFSIIGLIPHHPALFGFFLIEGRASEGSAARVVLLADCAVIPEPSVKQLALIGTEGAEAFRFFMQEAPRVAFLSFSTAGSAEHPFVDKVRQAAEMARTRAPQLPIEGEWQADAAVDSFTAGIKGVGSSSMAGQANVLVVPDLNCGNIAYKLVQRLGGCRAVGPILWGTAQPANDLSRGCSAEDVLDMMALTVLQSQHMKVKVAH